QVPGVSILTDGNPAGGATVRIRGVSTLNNNDPLYIIDGVPTKGSAFNILNSNDIESIQVLKDGSSAAIYGSRASNGVIIVTTKQARSGQFQVTYNTAFTHSKNSIKPQMLGTVDRERIQWQAMINDGNNPDDIPFVSYDWEVDGNGRAILNGIDIPDEIIPGVPSANTDWFDAITRDGFVQEHNLTVSGGGENTGTLFSLRYYENQYVLHKKDNQRYSARINSYQQLFDKRVKIGQNLSVSNVLDNGLSSTLPLNTALSLRSILPIFNSDGSYSGPVTGAFVDQQNPYMLLDINNWDSRQNVNIFGNVYLTANLLENLIFNSNIGIDWRSGLTRDIERTYATGILTRDINSLRNTDAEDINWNVNATLQYNFGQNNHIFDALIGTEVLQNRTRSNASYKEGFALETFDYFVENAGTGLQLANGSRSGYSLLSFFGKINYAFQNKYLVSLTTRYDGSSRFGKNNRFGFFPSASVGWKLDQESFISDNFSFFNELKLRAAWGVTGNQEISNTAVYTVYNPHYGEAEVAFNSDNGTAYDIYGNDSGLLPSGYRKTQTGNDDLRWEQSSELNLGLDFALFDFFGSFDLFDKQTKDILISPVYLAAIGEGGNRFFNGASMRTKGFEILLGYRKQIGEFGYTLTGNIGHYRDQITDLPPEVVSSYPGNVEQNILGRSVNSMFGYVTDGIFKTTEEVEAHANQPGKDIGRLRYKDLNNDGAINALDQAYIGVSTPRYDYGVNLAIEYGKFDFSAFFQGVFGREVNNTIKQRTDFASLWAGINYGERILNAWTPDNPSATIPAVTLVNSNNEGRLSTYFIENGAYMKLRQVSIGYNIGAFRFVKNLRLYATGENLFIIKDNSGANAFTAMDPENPNNTFPIPRNLTFGLSVTF
ncbi:MAG TPA: SusC/RagA family TonB-linked outer membrane protein, partial [Parapedobacter sp.]|nr:SusC/RagA family TonB-linked outer membrane protein [Parapedobacter sp.]